VRADRLADRLVAAASSSAGGRGGQDVAAVEGGPGAGVVLVAPAKGSSPMAGEEPPAGLRRTRARQIVSLHPVSHEPGADLVDFCRVCRA